MAEIGIIIPPRLIQVGRLGDDHLVHYDVNGARRLDHRQLPAFHLLNAHGQNIGDAHLHIVSIDDAQTHTGGRDMLPLFYFQLSVVEFVGTGGQQLIVFVVFFVEGLHQFGVHLHVDRQVLGGQRRGSHVDTDGRRNIVYGECRRHVFAFSAHDVHSVIITRAVFTSNPKQNR